MKKPPIVFESFDGLARVRSVSTPHSRFFGAVFLVELEVVIAIAAASDLQSTGLIFCWMLKLEDKIKAQAEIRQWAKACGVEVDADVMNRVTETPEENVFVGRTCRVVVAPRPGPKEFPKISFLPVGGA